MEIVGSHSELTPTRPSDIVEARCFSSGVILTAEKIGHHHRIYSHDANRDNENADSNEEKERTSMERKNCCSSVILANAKFS